MALGYGAIEKPAVISAVYSRERDYLRNGSNYDSGNNIDCISFVQIHVLRGKGQLGV